MDKAKIARINELSGESKTRDLTPEEKKEQAQLRKEFILEIRADLKSQLENIEVVDDTIDDDIDEMEEKIDEDIDQIEKEDLN